MFEESKIEATHRLQADGRWDEASRYRDQQRKHFKAQGLKRAEANDKAWEAMIEEYPPADIDDVLFYYTLAKFPPSTSHKVSDRSPEFLDVWWALCATVRVGLWRGPVEDSTATHDIYTRSVLEVKPKVRKWRQLVEKSALSGDGALSGRGSAGRDDGASRPRLGSTSGYDPGRGPSS